MEDPKTLEEAIQRIQELKGELKRNDLKIARLTAEACKRQRSTYARAFRLHQGWSREYRRRRCTPERHARTQRHGRTEQTVYVWWTKGVAILPSSPVALAAEQTALSQCPPAVPTSSAHKQCPPAVPTS
eukprot:14403174-Alexandrium_andersonii.AAC.1